jgi:flagellum-specific peptidoglycan hydrolase FlgJ
MSINNSQQLTFIKLMKPYAEKAARDIAVISGGGGGLTADVLLAQWAHETDYGTSNGALVKNNFAGIMKSGRGKRHADIQHN